MSKKCELTGKSPLKGHRVSHANNKVKKIVLITIKFFFFSINFSNDVPEI